MAHDTVSALQTPENAPRRPRPPGYEERKAARRSAVHPTPDGAKRGVWDYGLDDQGNGVRLRDLLTEAGTVRVAHTAEDKASPWRVWDPKENRWLSGCDAENSVDLLARQLGEVVLGEIRKGMAEDVHKKYQNWASKSRSTQTKRNAKAELAVIVRVPSEEWDRPELMSLGVPCVDGIHLFEGDKVRPYSVGDRVLTYVGHVPRPMPTPTFDQVLRHCIPEEEAREYVLDRVACCLANALDGARRLTLLNGPTQNGKSTMGTALRLALGPFGGALDMKALHQPRGGNRPSPALMGLRGKLLGVISESEEGGEALNGPLIKNYLGGDLLSMRALYQNMTEFTPTADLWGGVNELPRLARADLAIFERAESIPAGGETIPRAKRRKLRPALQAEAPGVLWGLLRRARVLHPAFAPERPWSVLEETKRWKAAAVGPVGAWVVGGCRPEPVWTSTRALLSAYRFLGEDQPYAQDERSFGKELRAAMRDVRRVFPEWEGARPERQGGTGVAGWVGIDP